MNEIQYIVFCKMKPEGKESNAYSQY